MKTFISLLLIITLFSVQGKNLNTLNRHITLQSYFERLKNDHRIISGQQATRGQFPWQVALDLFMPNGNRHFCGGSLISPKWVMTAAHCVDGVEYFVATFGITDLNDFDTPGRISALSFNGFHHEDYNEYINNDIALIEMPSEIPLSDTIQTIRLPRRSEQNDTLENLKVTISGWGKTSDASNQVSQYLNYVELDTLSNAKCQEIYGPEVVISSTVCAVGHPEHSPCNGDSGGPLIHRDAERIPTQYGIASFVHDEGCASGNPSAYVRPASFLDWIHKHTGIPIQD